MSRVIHVHLHRHRSEDAGTSEGAKKASLGRHSLRHNLTGKGGLRLTHFTRHNERSTPGEHEGRRQAEKEVNEHPQHRQHGPWRSTHSYWES